MRGWLIAKRIAELRSQKGFTQRDLARLLAREHGLVSRIETCERRVELVELIQILTAIGCDVEHEIGRLVADLLRITPLTNPAPGFEAACRTGDCPSPGECGSDARETGQDGRS